MSSIQRLANQEEIQNLRNTFVINEWKFSQLSSQQTGDEELIEDDYESFYTNSLKRWEENIGALIIVTEFQNYDFSIFTIQMISRDKHSNQIFETTSQNVIKTEDEFKILEPGTMRFDISMGIKQTPSFHSQNGPGRPIRPTTQSIILANKVMNLISLRKMNISDACKEIGIRRNTYYRTAKWLAMNTSII